MMRGRTALPFLLVLMCASAGWTQTSFPSRNETSYTTRNQTSYTTRNQTSYTTRNVGYSSLRNATSVFPSLYPKAYNCTKRDGTSLTALMDSFMMYQSVSYYIEQVLNRLSARFPCVIRQYTSVVLDYKETNETITTDKNIFLKSITRNSWENYYDYYAAYNHMQNCNQSLLYGLKRALEISPAESIIIVYTFGSIADYNDTKLMSDVYTLLEKKKSQVHFLWDPWYCAANSSQQDIFNNLSSPSFGQVMNMGYLNYFKLMKSMELLLSKPLNSSVRILDLNLNLNVTTNYTKAFNITNSLKHLLIAGVDTFTLSFTNPNGSAIVYEKIPSDSYYYRNYVSYYLVKSPVMGVWTLNAKGNGSLSVRILGFTGLQISGNCSDSACHPNATCGEFGGDQQCTCKEGFSGDGYSCEDVNECMDYYSNNCNFYASGYCVNTIGSYTCYCYGGSVYKKELGCVNIDRCADSSLNDCHPLAVCTNYNYGYYTCNCPYGYYGDGRYCEVNECLQGSPCGSSQCIKYNGSYSCFDPCYNYTLLDDPWRSTSNVHNYNDYLYSYDWVHCDSALSGWYRLKIGSSQQMPEYCVPMYSCGTHAPMWLQGSHPTIGDGIVNRTACAHWSGVCCLWSNTVSVKKCYGGYYVYKIQGTPACHLSYCIESNYSCSSLSCASDEECKFVNGVEGCHCKNSSNIGSIQPENLADYVTPKVLCGLDTIEVTFSKCLLENLGYNTSSFHLNSDFCRGVYSKKDKAYITLSTKPINGFCGGYTTSTQNVITYANTVYLTPKAEEGNKRKEYAINFKCPYPANMDINLITPINSLTASVTINVTGTSNFTITMGLFQDSGYTTPYTGSEVWLDSSSILYVGILVTGSSGSSPFVLLMKNCYATSTANETYGMRYDIIKDRCPNKNNPTISVPENGISLKGRFSFQVFKYLGGFDQVYLHCQVGLCDTSSYDCSAGCPLVRAADSVETLQTFTLGPIKYKASSSSNGGPQSSDGGAGWVQGTMSANGTISTDFLLLALSDLPDLKVFLFCVLLLLYLLTLTGNTVIILVSQLDKQLQNPMYFFLANLAFLDIFYTSTTMPKILQVLLAKTKSITFVGCVAQLYLFVASVGTEHVLLLVMSYDRFLAICRPLRYMTMMSQNVCVGLAFVSWFSGIVNSTVHTTFTFRLHFCGTRNINYFFCDIPPLLSLSCDDTSVNEALLLSIGVLIGWAPFLSIIISYIYIIVTIMKIRSAEGRQKAFSTCASHLTVVFLYYGSAVFNYVRPVSTYSLSKDRLISVLYSMVIPMLNPVIYTLKNQDVKSAFSRQFIQRKKR